MCAVCSQFENCIPLFFHWRWPVTAWPMYGFSIQQPARSAELKTQAECKFCSFLLIEFSQYEGYEALKLWRILLVWVLNNPFLFAYCKGSKVESLGNSPFSCVLFNVIPARLSRHNPVKQKCFKSMLKVPAHTLCSLAWYWINERKTSLNLPWLEIVCVSG